MTTIATFGKLDRRTVLKGAAAAGLTQVASPFIIQARGDTPVRIGMVDPLTGVYAAVALHYLDGFEERYARAIAVARAANRWRYCVRPLGFPRRRCPLSGER